jgi:hypothetical protein
MELHPVAGPHGPGTVAVLRCPRCDERIGFCCDVTSAGDLVLVASVLDLCAFGPM